jgi:hypothetical protein
VQLAQGDVRGTARGGALTALRMFSVPATIGGSRRAPPMPVLSLPILATTVCKEGSLAQALVVMGALI